MSALGSWLCENSSARRARRNISKKLRIMESNDAARAMFDVLLENCIFYISPMYEFLHSQGQSRRSNTSDESAGWRPNFGAAANRRGVLSRPQANETAANLPEPNDRTRLSYTLALSK